MRTRPIKIGPVQCTTKRRNKRLEIMRENRKHSLFLTLHLKLVNIYYSFPAWTLNDKRYCLEVLL